MDQKKKKIARARAEFAPSLGAYRDGERRIKATVSEMKQLEGRRLLQVVNGGDCLELWFERGPGGTNLVAVWPDDGHDGRLLNGRIDLGYIAIGGGW